MHGDVALAGFLMTAEEWQELDPATREALAAAAGAESPPKRRRARTRQPRRLP